MRPNLFLAHAQPLVRNQLANQQAQPNAFLGGFSEIFQRRRLVVILDAQPAHRVVLHRVHFLVLQRLRDIDRVRIDQRSHNLLANISFDLLLGLALHVVAYVLLEPLDSAFLHIEQPGQRVIHWRQRGLFDRVHHDREIDFLALQVLGVIILRKFDLEARLITGLDAREAFLEVGQHLALAQDYRDIRALAAVDRFAFEFAGEITDDTVAVLAGTINLAPRRFLLAQLVDHFVEIFIADRHVGLVYRNLLEILEFDLGHDFERRRIRETLAVIALVLLDLRRAGRVQVFLQYRVGVAPLQ